MERCKGVAVVLILVAFGGLPAFAQAVISTQAGLINLAEGSVFLNDKPLQSPRPGQFSQMRERDTLRTAALGRAEVLLNPGAFLRVDSETSVRLASGRIADARVDLLSGRALVEAVEVTKDNRITLVQGDATISILKSGLYRLEASPARLFVLNGKAIVRSGSQQVEVGRGRVARLAGELVATKFKNDRSDGLNAWSERRAERLARLNMITARTLQQQSGLPRTSLWGFSALLGGFTYIPYNNSYASPYGYYFWSPATVYQAYQQPQATSGFGSAENRNFPSSPSISPGSWSGGSGGVSSSSSSSRSAAPAATPPPAISGGRSAP